MPVLTAVAAARRPRKRSNPSAVPAGTPMAIAIAVALSDTVAVRRHQLPHERRRRRAHCAPASGWNSAWPYLRLPKLPIRRWVGALVIQRENACAQPTLVPACLTTITW